MARQKKTVQHAAQKGNAHDMENKTFETAGKNSYPKHRSLHIFNAVNAECLFSDGDTNEAG